MQISLKFDFLETMISEILGFDCVCVVLIVVNCIRCDIAHGSDDKGYSSVSGKCGRRRDKIAS